MKLASKGNIETPSLSDNELWTELKKGNPDVLGVLFCKFYDDLYFYGTQLVADKNLIIDTIQDVFTMLWENNKRLSDVQHTKAYIFKIFRNKLLKAPKKSLSFFLSKDISKIPEKEFNLSEEDIIIEQESRSKISKTISNALKGMTDKQREILYLKFYCNLSNTSISQTLSINKQSVSNLLNRSINTFRKKLINYDL